MVETFQQVWGKPGMCFCEGWAVDSDGEVNSCHAWNMTFLQFWNSELTFEDTWRESAKTRIRKTALINVMICFSICHSAKMYRTLVSLSNSPAANLFFPRFLFLQILVMLHGGLVPLHSPEVQCPQLQVPLSHLVSAAWVTRRRRCRRKKLSIVPYRLLTAPMENP